MIHFEQKRRTILAYLKAYNNLDIPGMLRCLHHEVLFENYAGQQRTLRLEGIKAFENQAHTTLAFFSEREQIPSNWRFEEDSVRIDVHFRATPSVDFPNGWKEGIPVHLQGTSTFRFKDQRIVEIIDKT